MSGSDNCDFAHQLGKRRSPTEEIVRKAAALSRRISSASVHKYGPVGWNPGNADERFELIEARSQKLEGQDSGIS